MRRGDGGRVRVSGKGVIVGGLSWLCVLSIAGRC